VNMCNLSLVTNTHAFTKFGLNFSFNTEGEAS
jgi:hypothetical protein